MNDPLKIMDEYLYTPSEDPSIIDPILNRLRIAIEAQSEELTNAQARIGRLEDAINCIYYWYELSDGTTKARTDQIKNLKSVARETPRQSLAAVKVETLRDCAKLMSNGPSADFVKAEADRLEREAKE